MDTYNIRFDSATIVRVIAKIVMAASINGSQRSMTRVTSSSDLAAFETIKWHHNDAQQTTINKTGVDNHLKNRPISGYNE